MRKTKSSAPAAADAAADDAAARKAARRAARRAAALAAAALVRRELPPTPPAAGAGAGAPARRADVPAPSPAPSPAPAPAPSGGRAPYWAGRFDSLYYRAVYQIVAVAGDGARSVIDIGSAETDYVTWFDWIDEKVQLNRGFTREGPEGVRRISADFLAWAPDKVYDIGLCLQVLEHVEDAKGFCDRLKAVARQLVVSVPWMWPAGRVASHIHDPVDEAKLHGWMGLRPNFQMQVTEPFGPTRLIAWYDLEHGPAHRIPRELSRARIAARARGPGQG